MAPRKPKVPALTDIRVVQQWHIKKDENGMDGYVLSGWEIQVQRGTDEWEKIDIENVVLPDDPKETINV
jgi:hypothetical protein